MLAKRDMLCGGIDVGGTKIEARLFDGIDAATRVARRVLTPREDFDEFCAAIIDQCNWLCDQAKGRLPIGLSLAGFVDPLTDESFAANLPTTGRKLGVVLEEALGMPLQVMNDCMAFTVSEARGGAADGARNVVGLIMGTGLGAGICLDSWVPYRQAGLAVEVGHLGTPADALSRHGLPVLPCGCGRKGCFEPYVSGTGIANIAEVKLGRRAHAHDLIAEGGADADLVLSIWQDLAGECLSAIQMMHDPECIVIGGGLSNMDRVAERLTAGLERNRLGNVRMPRILVAQHGDSSGARGAALIAREEWLI